MNITIQTIKSIIKSNYETELQGIKVHQIIANLLKEKWHGKKITKRIEGQLKQALSEPNAVINFSKDFGLGYIKIWRTKDWPTYQDEKQFFLGYDRQPSNPQLEGSYLEDYKAEAFEESDCCHGRAAIERNKRRQEILADNCKLAVLSTSLQSLRDHWQTVQNIIDKGSPDFPDRYEIEKLAGLEEIRNH